MNKKQTRLSRIRFFIIITIAGAFGAVVGITLSASRHKLNDIVKIVGEAVIENPSYITIFSACCLRR